MHLSAQIEKRTLLFKKTATTSRGSMQSRDVWFIKIYDKDGTLPYGLGECAPLPYLSPDFSKDYQHLIERICQRISKQSLDIDLKWNDPEFLVSLYAGLIPEELPSMRFGIETAMRDFFNGGKGLIYQTGFSEGISGIPINGLVWMNTPDEMRAQAFDLVKRSFKVIKLKIGVNWREEKKIIEALRALPTGKDLEIRVDANGAFTLNEARQVLKELAELKVHSIEQPLKAGMVQEMAQLSSEKLLPIALDEELVSIWDSEQRIKTIETIKPQYLILKPGLLGGMQVSEELIKYAELKGMGWWITSALESNLGLNAIAQFTAKYQLTMAQGLGTGSLYQNNVQSPLEVLGTKLWYSPNAGWKL